VAVTATVPAPLTARAKFTVPIPPKVRVTELVAVLISETSASSDVYLALSLHSRLVSSTQFPFASCWMMSPTLGAGGRLGSLGGLGGGSESPDSASESDEVRLPA